MWRNWQEAELMLVLLSGLKECKPTDLTATQTLAEALLQATLHGALSLHCAEMGSKWS